jgi:hypothetical protein
MYSIFFFPPISIWEGGFPGPISIEEKKIASPDDDNATVVESTFRERIFP